MSYHPNMTKRALQALALATLLVAMPAVASDELQRQQPDTIIFAMMSGKCRTFKVGGRDLPCRAVAFFQTEEGRANFTIAIKLLQALGRELSVRIRYANLTIQQLET